MLVDVATVGEHKQRLLTEQTLVPFSANVWRQNNIFSVRNEERCTCHSLQWRHCRWRHLQCQMTHVGMWQWHSGCCQH